MGTQFSRRSLLVMAGAGIGAALTACSRGSGGNGDATGGGADGSETVRFTFWGPAFYQEFTAEMVDAFGQVNSDIAVTLEPAEWGGYWDRLATQMAAADEPDVINMDGKYLAEYAGRGALADLEQLDIDISKVAASDLDSGRIDGTLYAISTGQNAWVILANPAVLEAAGVEMPDDTTWTWDDLASIATTVSDEVDDAVGITGGGSYADLTIWARQHGQDLWQSDGMAISEDVLAGWFQWYLDLQDSGATLDASRTQEEGTLSLEQQAFSVGKAGLTWAWTNQLGSIRTAVGSEDIVMLRPPSVTGVATENGLFGKASMFWSISARSEVPEGAARLVDFLVNDPAANAIQLLNRGVPSNPELVAGFEADLTPTDTYVVEFLTAVLAEISTTPAVQPTGTSGAQDVFTRYLTDVRFGSTTPEAAAAGTITDVNASVVTG